MGCSHIEKAVYREYRKKGYSKTRSKKIAGAVAGKIKRAKHKK